MANEDTPFASEATAQQPSGETTNDALHAEHAQRSDQRNPAAQGPRLEWAKLILPMIVNVAIALTAGVYTYNANHWEQDRRDREDTQRRRKLMEEALRYPRVGESTLSQALTLAAFSSDADEVLKLVKPYLASPEAGVRESAAALVRSAFLVNPSQREGVVDRLTRFLEEEGPYGRAGALASLTKITPYLTESQELHVLNAVRHVIALAPTARETLTERELTYKESAVFLGGFSMRKATFELFLQILQASSDSATYAQISHGIVECARQQVTNRKEMIIRMQHSRDNLSREAQAWLDRTVESIENL